jgi:hypothetical protein
MLQAGVPSSAAAQHPALSSLPQHAQAGAGVSPPRSANTPVRAGGTTQHQPESAGLTPEVRIPGNTPWRKTWEEQNSWLTPSSSIGTPGNNIHQVLPTDHARAMRLDSHENLNPACRPQAFVDTSHLSSREMWSDEESLPSTPTPAPAKVISTHCCAPEFFIF